MPAEMMKEHYPFKRIVADDLRFKMALDMGEKSFRWLSKADNTQEAVSSLAVGGSIFGGVAALTAPTGFGGILVALGLASNPIGWAVGAGIAGGGLAFLGSRWLKSLKEATTIKIPKYINTPLDALGLQICELLVPALIKIAHSDDNASKDELDLIKRYFIDTWGIDKDFIRSYMESVDDHIDTFSFVELSEQMKTISRKSKDVDYRSLALRLVATAEEIVNSDGVQHPKEKSAIESLKNAFGLNEDRFKTMMVPSLFTSLNSIRAVFTKE